MRTVLMVLFDQVQSLDVTGPLEVFTGANTWQAGRADEPAYDIRTASLGGRPVRTSSGLCRATGQPGAAPRGAAVDRRPPRRGPVGGDAGPPGQLVPAAVRPGLRGRGGHAAGPVRRPGPFACHQ